MLYEINFSLFSTPFYISKKKKINKGSFTSKFPATFCNCILLNVTWGTKEISRLGSRSGIKSEGL